ncbi:hypothetical protein KVR01_004644 [Diaporthe batatas]|uniref:uncharacterized protein n=1 Tax=Diaporthe batatas TaxID=748121 RepID=UPI001D03EC23|nr:uncharacterized protein KVR01_004644 [Diaporthe batatas]KAG8166092.1 hypothetical protein KVR01_004644 [Diaporthe batatas]
MSYHAPQSPSRQHEIILYTVSQVSNAVGRPRILTDLHFLDARRETLVPSEERAHAEQLVRTDEFRRWTQSRGSSQLLVHGHLPAGAARGRPSGLSYVCLSLANVLMEHADRFINLVFFCDMETVHYGWPRSDGREMIRSLLYQLLAQMRRLGIIHSFAWTPQYFQDIRRGDLDALTAQFEHLIYITPPHLTICCVVDGTNYRALSWLNIACLFPWLVSARDAVAPSTSIITPNRRPTEAMAITVTSLRTIVSTGASATQTTTVATTLTITPNPLTTAFEPPPYCTQSYLSNCQTDVVSGTYPCFQRPVLLPAHPGRPGQHLPVLARAELSPRLVDGGTVTAGQETMVVNGLSQCPASTTVFSLGRDPVQLTWLNADSTSMSISGTPVFTVSAERVALLYRSSDVAAAAGASSAATGGADAGPGPSGSASSGSGSSGLSAGAVAGIAIGAAAVGVLLVSGLFWLCLRRRRSAQGPAAAYYNSQGGDAHHPPPAPAHAPSPGHAPAGAAVHELKASGCAVSSPQVLPAGHAAPNATELLGSTPSDHRWVGLPQDGVDSRRGGGTPVPVPGEVSVSNDYYQLPGTYERGQGPLDDSRQNTPINLVGPGAGGRGYPPEKTGW